MKYDILILGGGPAGYTAALYAVRAGRKTAIIERMAPGGQMCQTAQIDNYPGFPEGVDGNTLGMMMQSQAERFGAETVWGEIGAVDLSGDVKTITVDGAEYEADAVIIATGAEHRHLGVKGEEAFLGRGVGYCAACDGMLFKNKTVAVIGGGDTAAGDALLLAGICAKVYLIHRRSELRATRIYRDALPKNEKVEMVLNANLLSIEGEGKVAAIEVQTETGTRRIDVDGVFISIGRAPETALFRGQVALDEGGYIIAGEDTKTNLPGVFAAGDVRTKTLRQVVTAVSDGAVAAHEAEAYFASREA